jgi:hypothetical protein
MTQATFWNDRRTAGIFLSLALPLGAIGVIAATAGAGYDFQTEVTRPDAPLKGLFTAVKNLFSPELSISGWSRIMIGLVAPVTALTGLAMLTTLLRDAGERALSMLGAVSYLVAAIFIMFVEVDTITGRAYREDYANVFAILAFLSQAFYGGALLRTRLVPAWVASITIAWNIGWLLVFYAVNYPYGTGYYPMWNLVTTFLIGVVLLLPSRQSAAMRAFRPGAQPPAGVSAAGSDPAL